MFTVDSVHDNIMTVTVGGRIDADTMIEGLDDMFRGAEQIEHGGLLMNYTDLALPTLGAFRAELARLGDAFTLIRRFDKVAVLSNQGWVRTAAKIEGALMPGIEIRAYPPEDRNAAIAWLTVDPKLDLPG